MQGGTDESRGGERQLGIAKCAVFGRRAGGSENDQEVRESAEVVGARERQKKLPRV